VQAAHYRSVAEGVSPCINIAGNVVWDQEESVGFWPAMNE